MSLNSYIICEISMKENTRNYRMRAGKKEIKSKIIKILLKSVKRTNRKGQTLKTNKKEALIHKLSGRV